MSSHAPPAGGGQTTHTPLGGGQTPTAFGEDSLRLWIHCVGCKLSICGGLAEMWRTKDSERSRLTTKRCPLQYCCWSFGLYLAGVLADSRRKVYIVSDGARAAVRTRLWKNYCFGAWQLFNMKEHTKICSHKSLYFQNTTHLTVSKNV